LVLETLETRCLLSATLVKDLNTAVGSSILPSEFTAVNGTAFFPADDGVHGLELWKTDGTKAGTQMVKDINQRGGAAFHVFPTDLTNVNGTLFFPADDGVHGLALWKSDGTRAGTVLVKDFGLAEGTTGFGPYFLTNVQGTLFFSLTSGPADMQGLWTSDGTSAGTVRISSVVADTGVDVNGTYFFLGNDAMHVSGLWKSDGTPAGTVFLKRVSEQEPAELVNVNGTLFFNGSGHDGLQKLWKSDGTSNGTVPVDEAGLLGSYPENLTSVNGTLFFQAGTNGFNSRQLWKTDGTDAGTSIVKIINPAGNAFGFQADRNSFANVNGTLYVTASDGTSLGIWKSDGTANGTVLVKYLSSASELTNANGTLYFNGSDAAQGTGLWTSDGTSNGTVLVQNLNEVFGFLSLTAVNGRLFFRENDGIHGVEPWTSDGTTAGTEMLKDIYPGDQSANIQNLTELNGSLYFLNSAGDPGNTGLLVSDGTAGGTVQVSGVSGTNLTKAGGLLYFNGPGTGIATQGLWESDGTAAGTFRVTSLGHGSGPQNLTDVNGTLFFTVTPMGGDPQLWESDGTSAGTKELTTGASIADLTAVNGRLFFALDDRVDGNELWVSDGTPGGTHLVKDIYPGSTGSNPASLANVNGTLFFSADDGVHGRELWESDGTPGGTFLAADINQGPDGSDPRGLTVSNGLLYFSAFTPATGRELWDYDPATGNVSAFDINPGPANSNPSSLTDVNGVLFFAANDGAHGQELWMTDGTPNGTQLVADINPGSKGSRPENLYAMNGVLYFTAEDGTHGRQLWRSDGTPGGTFLVQQISPGRSSAFYPFYNPGFTVANGHLFFVANDRVHGRELWVYTPDSAPGVPHRLRDHQVTPVGAFPTLVALPNEFAPSPTPVIPAAPEFSLDRDAVSPPQAFLAPLGQGRMAEGLRPWPRTGSGMEDQWTVEALAAGAWLSDEALVALAKG
jgi:ELWxxDGT repeat protein